MRVLVACEYSGIVRDAFLAAGHDAMSCDLLPTESAGPHFQGDCREAIRSRRWNLIILHVPCTAMGICGNGTYGAGKAKSIERAEAITWTCETYELARQYADSVALENPASVIFPILRRRYGVAVQYVQPWQYGSPEQKKTGLALHNLRPLVGTDDVYEAMMKLPRSERERVFFMAPGPDRGKERARFFPGIAAAMATQWGDPARLARIGRQTALQFAA